MWHEARKQERKIRGMWLYSLTTIRFFKRNLHHSKIVGIDL